MTSPHAILFDFDGTLVDSEPLHQRCWAEAIEPWGPGPSWDDYRRFVGITDREAGRIMLTEAGHNATDELIRAACARKHQIYRSRCAEELKILEENVAFIQEIARLIPVGVVSSSVTLELSPVLQAAGLDSTIRVMVCGDHVKKHKPDPEPYLLALHLLRERSDWIDASECVVFEDSDAGMTSAAAAGMRVVRVDHPTSLADLLRSQLAGHV